MPNLRERLFMALLVLTAGFACGNQGATQELLDANFLTRGQTAIDLISPTQNQQVATATPQFSWSSRGVSAYTLELATDSAFKNKILQKDVNGTTYALASTDLTGVSTLTTSTYYWRVKIAMIKDNLQSATQSFLLMVLPSGGSGSAGALYVDKNSSASTQIGSKEAPYKTISGAISAADALRNNNQSITLDILVAKGDYSEEVNLVEGISLRGGYDSTDWSRNISTNVSKILGPTDAAVRSGSGITSATVVDGFTVVGATISGASSYGVLAISSSPTISNNYIDCGNGAQCYGIQNTNSSPTISGNTITGKASTGNFAIYNQLTSSPTIVNNVIFGGHANNSVGIYSNNSSPKIENNTISGGTATTIIGIRMIAGTSARIRNNIIFSSTGGGTCIEEFTSGTTNPTAVDNNNVFGCATLYQNNDAGAVAMNNICAATGNFWTGAGCTGTQLTTPSGSGNISVNNAAPLFVNINGTDGNINTMADNDWRLGTAAANCNVRGGGLTIAGITFDRDGLSRTANVPLSGACTPANNGNAGWSMGAYEND